MIPSTVEAVSWTGPADGPVVALVHGAMDRAAGLARIARRLDDRARTVRYDRRGYGHSVGHPGPFTISDHVDDLLGVLAGRPAVLVGHSLGGVVVLAAAARRPDLALGVAVYEPPTPWVPWWPSDSSSGRTAQAADDLTTEETEELAERFMRRLIGNRRWEELPDRTRRIRRSEGRVLVGELRDLRSAPFDIERVRCPVIVGMGEHARPHHRRASEELVTAIGPARLVELPGCHHDAHTGHPALFVEELIVPLLESTAGRGAGSGVSS